MQSTDSEQIDPMLFKQSVYLLLLFSIFAFLAGFLQNTDFGFVIYVLYFVLFTGGIRLIWITLLSGLRGILRVLLLLTGFTSILYFLLFTFACIRSTFVKLSLIEILTDLEGIFYLVSLVFLMSAAGSLVMLRR